MAKQHSIFIPINKIDEERRLVFGIATEELPDKQGEICDYESSKPFYEKWSSDIEKATDGKSKGNLRVMHTSKVAGTIPQISFNDDTKQIEICAKVVDDEEWKMVLAGGYTGFSQGGSYEKKWKDGEFTRYTSNPCEISLVDNPCLSSATFEVLKSDGSIELRKFQTLEQNTMTKITEKEVTKAEVTQGWQASDGSFHLNKSAALAHNEELEKATSKEKDEEDDKEGDEDETDKADKSKDTEEKDSETGDDKKDGKARDAKPGKEKKNTKEKDDAKKVDGTSEDGLKKFIGDEVFDASRAIEALLIVMGLLSTESFEAKFEGENEPGQLSDLKLVIEKLKSFIASEIMEKEPEDGVMQMSDKGDLEKAGAKISAANKSHLDKMHKSAKDHMECMTECMKSLGAMEDDGAEDKKADEKETKKSAEVDALQKNLEDKTSGELQKLSGTIDKLLKRIDDLESQPAIAKGVKLVLKDHEDEIGNSNPVEDVSNILKNVAHESPMIQAQKLIKHIQSQK